EVDVDEVDADDVEADEVTDEVEGDAAEAEADAAEADTSDADTSDADAPAAPVARRDSPYDRPGRGYVLHTQSGYENKVKSNLEARTQSMNMEERIFEIVIPLEDVVEFKNGKKVVVQKKVFPGYLLVRLRLDDDSWFVVRNTP
ncbi:transcription termination/antitermination NusG family protein, partial [Shigella flexneri]|uniref:transcription termination/antitermination NusG family protein n=1 Tax=Shigella flexneri TaxID=623 RepID=UPI000AE2437F